MTEQEKKQRISEYNRRYYNEKRKKQLQEKRLLAEKKLNGEQLTLFKDQLPDTVLPNENNGGDEEENTSKGVQLTMFDIENDLENQNSRSLEIENEKQNLESSNSSFKPLKNHQEDPNAHTSPPSDSGILPNEKKKISILRDSIKQEQSIITLKNDNSRDLELEKPVLENSRSIENLNFKNQFQNSIAFQDQDLVSSFVELVKERAKETLFPNVEHKKRTLWKTLEIAVNLLMILGCLFVLTQTVRVIDQALFLPVLTCEVVAIFFSFSVSKTKGANKIFSLFIVTFAILLSNALIVKSIHQDALKTSQIALESTKIRETIKAQIELEKAIISDLTARSRYTLAKDHQKRLDELVKKIEVRASFSYPVSPDMVIFQILVRFLVSLALVLCVHRIGYSL